MDFTYANMLGIHAFDLLGRIVIPNILTMTERGVEDPSFAECLAPGNGKVTVLLFLIRVLVQTQQ